MSFTKVKKIFIPEIHFSAHYESRRTQEFTVHVRKLKHALTFPFHIRKEKNNIEEKKVLATAADW